jgi:transcription initiation factor TFIIF subunit beta
MSSTNINTNTSNGSNELDITNASRGVWLVKVPKYMNTKWQKASPMTEIGRLQINKYSIISFICFYY